MWTANKRVSSKVKFSLVSHDCAHVPSSPIIYAVFCWLRSNHRFDLHSRGGVAKESEHQVSVLGVTLDSVHLQSPKWKTQL
jgi:hypothetical protein